MKKKVKGCKKGKHYIITRTKSDIVSGFINLNYFNEGFTCFFCGKKFKVEYRAIK